jgi:hypothetical protein
MNVHHWRRLSIGEWAAICRTWNKVHGVDSVAPPSEEEFERAVMAARGLS